VQVSPQDSGKLRLRQSQTQSLFWEGEGFPKLARRPTPLVKGLR